MDLFRKLEILKYRAPADLVSKLQDRLLAYTQFGAISVQSLPRLQFAAEDMPRDYFRLET